MKSRLAQLRSDLAFASILLMAALGLLALAFASPRRAPSPHPPTSHGEKIIPDNPQKV